MIKRVLLIVIALLVPFVLLGQTVGKIIGTVTDRETGDALPGANVVIEGTKGYANSFTISTTIFCTEKF